MKYISTRGDSPKLNFTEVLLGGLAPDGGLYLPEHYPKFTNDELNDMREMSYQDLAFYIFEKFIDDIPENDLREIVNKTYSAETFSYAREEQKAEDITPTLPLKNNLFLLSLSNGPTLAFKDIAMQFLGHIFEYVLGKQGKTLNILGATSGDTGPAAEYAMKGKKGIKVFMLSPHGTMSPFQSAQMYSLHDTNIFNIAIKGVFDDCQDIVKAVSKDLEFKSLNKIGAVNSINWGRILAQIVYYFKGYFDVTTKNSEKVDFTVPTGNFGNICAGHIARMMGLPINHLVVATNENDVLDEFFNTGNYAPRSSEDTFQTSSPSMDISKASNFERFIFDLLGRDSSALNDHWKKIDEGKSFKLKEENFQKIKDYGFVSSSSKHINRVNFIRSIYNDFGVIIDTHTADGIKAAMDHSTSINPMVVLETALPVKFEKSVFEAIGVYPKRPDSLKDLELLDQKFEVFENSVESVKKYITDNR
ncbi:threonine synthase [Methylophilaceae bacterium]|jgi:threonine synthase|nr:threonine synthase [Methylophilaceae bacterium]|tara:strand:- start:322 stop:1746 length:1425 start_codon:yes stop_codon:yes gene_type:complete